MIVIVSALGLIVCYAYYTTAGCKAYIEERDADSIEWSINSLKAYSFTALTIVLIISSFIMLRRLKEKFYGLYTDYGRKLWIIVLI